MITQRGLVSLSSRFELMIDEIASVFNQWLSNELSNNSSRLSASDASSRKLLHTKCQVVLLLSGGLGTENRKDGGSTPPLATTSDHAKWAIYMIYDRSLSH